MCLQTNLTEPKPLKVGISMACPVFDVNSKSNKRTLFVRLANAVRSAIVFPTFTSPKLAAISTVEPVPRGYFDKERS